MTIYVDNLFLWPGKRREYCHLMIDKDSNLNDLHNFAASIGVGRSWFENKKGRRSPHYDINAAQRSRAIELGAVAVDGIKMLTLCKR